MFSGNTIGHLCSGRGGSVISAFQDRLFPRLLLPSTSSQDSIPGCTRDSPSSTVWGWPLLILPGFHVGQWGPWMCLLTGCLLVERLGLSQKTPSHCSDEEEYTEHNSGSNFLHVSTHPSRPFPISGSFPPPGLLHTLLPLRLRFRILVTSALIFHLHTPTLAPRVGRATPQPALLSGI